MKKYMFYFCFSDFNVTFAFRRVKEENNKN